MIQASQSQLRKRLVPIAVLVIVAIIAYVILNNPPQAGRRGPSQAPQMSVQVEALQPKLYQIMLNSFGTVKPKTESMLVAQASGQIVQLADNFRDGGFFKKGDVLLQLDARDHQADVDIAKANLLDAKQQLAEQQAKAEQALQDWKRLGKSGQPNDLVLRKPQLAAAEAKLLSAKAQLTKAELTLERTKIVAPYDGRVLNKNVDLGQVVSNNMQLASIYATDVVEIRLPIKNQDLKLIDLPEEFSDRQGAKRKGNAVTFYSTLGNDQWQGNLVRTEGSIDSQSNQLYVVAQIDEPYVRSDKQMAIKIGQYLSAKVTGNLLTDALVIPVSSIYQGSYVYIVEEGVLLRKEITLLWKNEHEAVVQSGLNAGDNLVVTALGQVSSGTPVSIMGDESQQLSAKPQAKKRSFADLPTPVQERIKQEAESRNVSVEQVMKERREARASRGNN